LRSVTQHLGLTLLGYAAQTQPTNYELKAALDERWEVAGEAAEFVFDRLRRAVNQTETGGQAIHLRTQFHRLLEQAGVTPLAPLGVNLRSFRETELAERFPTYVTTAWLGHTPDRAQRTDRQALNAHFEAAAQTTSGASDAVHQAVQSAPEYRSYAAHAAPRNAENPLKKGSSRNRITPLGFEAEDESRLSKRKRLDFQRISAIRPRCNHLVLVQENAPKW
jgi:hypothetical protein